MICLIGGILDGEGEEEGLVKWLFSFILGFSYHSELVVCNRSRKLMGLGGLLLWLTLSICT